jgi:hypothetical protein
MTKPNVGPLSFQSSLYRVSQGMKLTTELSIESLQGKSGQEADHSPLSSAIVKNF